MVIYEGIFFDGESEKIIRNLEIKTLEKQIKDLHCTFAFRPNENELFDDIVSEYIEFVLLGYGYNLTNSGFSGGIPTTVLKYYKNYNKDGSIVVPHITTSISVTGKPVNTKFLQFDELAEPVIVPGRLGYFLNDGTVSFEKQKIKR